MSYNNFGQNPNYNLSQQNSYQGQQPLYTGYTTYPVAPNAPVVRNKSEDSLFRAWIILFCIPIVITVALMLLSPEMLAIASVVSLGCSLATLIIAITAKVKFPKSKKINVIFWIQMASIILYVLFIFVSLIMACIACHEIGL